MRPLTFRICPFSWPAHSAHILPATIRRNASNFLTHPTDSCGIPTKPVWSVNELLSSYSSPRLSSTTINRLYELSALVPPKEGTTQYDDVKRSLEEMVKLVEAVTLADTIGVSVDGRGEQEDSDREIAHSKPTDRKQELLRHSARTHDGFYVIDSERRR